MHKIASYSVRRDNAEHGRIWRLATHGICVVVGVREKFIASCSFGKDSAAMVLRLLEEKKPLDEVVFYDTGMEFDAIYKVRDMIVPRIEESGIKFTTLKPPRPFLYDMLARPVKRRDGSYLYGYGWCGGTCRWGTTEKTAAMDKYEAGCHWYVGIALDEPERLARLPEHKSSPLAEWGMTEADCLRYCREHGISWDEGGIDLYDVLDRVSCWCCSNKNYKELKAIHDYLPTYWEKLKALQTRISERPMKKWANKKYGAYGNVFDMERVFEDNGKCKM